MAYFFLDIHLESNIDHGSRLPYNVTISPRIFSGIYSFQTHLPRRLQPSTFNLKLERMLSQTRFIIENLCLIQLSKPDASIREAS